MRSYYVYILASKSQTLYVGITNNLERRVSEHKRKLIPGFTKKYNIDRLMYFQEFHDVNQAIENEKRIKKWNRNKKLFLIKTVNLQFKDLTEDVDLEISRFARDDKVGI